MRFLRSWIKVMEKEKKKAIHSWLLAKYETGEETDVVMREAMWYDFVNGIDFTRSETQTLTLQERPKGEPEEMEFSHASQEEAI